MTDGKIIELYFSRDESAISATANKYGAYLGKMLNKIVLKVLKKFRVCANI